MLCGEYLPLDSSLLFCSACLKNLPLIPPEHCPVCGKVTPSGSARCFQCHTEKNYFRQHRSVVFYTDEIRTVLLRYKFYKKRHYAGSIGTLMSSYVTEPYDFVTSVPISKERKRSRGYNQSQLLAKQIEKIRNIPYLDTLNKDCDTPPQSQLGYRQRRANLQHCFSPVNQQIWKGAKLLLIDDIFTTGATANECSKLLIRSGAESVDVLTFAMADKRIKSVKGTKKNETIW